MTEVSRADFEAAYRGQTRPRAVALCLFWREGALLVQEYWHPERQLPYFRPVGGAVEYGEWSHEAARREVREELGAEIRDLRHVATLENIFASDGVIAHEIAFIYEARFADPALYEPPFLAGQEANGQPFRAVWKRLDEFDEARGPLYPGGLAELLASHV